MSRAATTSITRWWTSGFLACGGTLFLLRKYASSLFTMKTISSLHRCTAPLIFACAFSTAFGQGALTPPGAPAPTMKSLDQVEARTIVNSTNTPGDASNTFIISAPGSYYLTGNLTGVSGKSGIQINADDVSLDLNGFS